MLHFSRRFCSLALGAIGLLPGHGEAAGVAHPPAPATRATPVVNAGGPTNDNFANATPLSISAKNTLTATTVGATTETGEPYCGHRTLWYTFTASTSTPLSVDTVGSSVSTCLNVYQSTGSPASLTRLRLIRSGYGNVDGEPYQRYQPTLIFTPSVNVTYYVCVGDVSQAGGPVKLQVAPPPANDNFAGTQDLGATGRNYTLKVSNVGATTERYEPYSGSRTLWYKWTAPASTLVEVDTHGSSVDTVLTIWQAPLNRPLAMANLVGITRDYGYAINWAWYIPGATTFGYYGGSSRFQAVAGRVYYFQLGDSSYRAGGDLVFHLTTPPGNDNFAAATSLAANGTQSVTSDNFAASGETGEHASYLGAKAGVWYKWQPAAGGTLEVIDTAGSQLNSTLEVYTGSTLGTLTRIRHSNDVNALPGEYHVDSDYSSRVAFPVTANTVYYIRVAGVYYNGEAIYNQGDGEGAFQLNLHNYPAPSSAADHILWGRAYLEDGTPASLTQADAQFAQAISAAPTNGEANVLQALTKLSLQQQQPAYTQLLTQLGMANAAENPLRLNLSIPKDARGIPIPATNANSAQVLTYLQQTVVPLIPTLDAELAQVTDPNFKIRLTDSENSQRAANVDFADVQLLRAVLQAVRAASYFSETYNLVASLSTVSGQARANTLDVKSFKKTFGNILKFNSTDRRSDMSSAFKQANTNYQLGSSYVRQRADAFDHRYLFPLPAHQHKEVNLSKDLQNTSNSLGGEIRWDGKDRINLSKLITTSTALHDLLGNFQGNQVIANTVPDPTFAGSVPNGTQTQVNAVLREHRFLYDVSSYAAWASQLLPGSSPADQALTANPAGDGFNNAFKFAFGLDPRRASSTSEFLVQNLVRDAGTNQAYLTVSFVRRIDTAAVTYVVGLSNDLKTWDRTQTQLEQVGTPVPNDDGITETVTMRVKNSAAITSRQFLRVEAQVKSTP